MVRTYIRLPVEKANTNFFAFSMQYLVLTLLIYGSLVACPYIAITGHWEFFVPGLLVLVISFVALRAILRSYFEAARKPKQFADKMAILTVFPPVIGPIFVMRQTLIDGA